MERLFQQAKPAMGSTGTESAVESTEQPSSLIHNLLMPRHPAHWRFGYLGSKGAVAPRKKPDGCGWFIPSSAMNPRPTKNRMAMVVMAIFHVVHYPLVMTNIAMDNGPVEIVSFPIKKL